MKRQLRGSYVSGAPPRSSVGHSKTLTVCGHTCLLAQGPDSKLQEVLWDFQVREELTGHELLETWVCFSPKSCLASLCVFGSYFNKLIFDIWRSDINLGGFNTGAASVAADVPLSHKPLDPWWNSYQTSRLPDANCSGKKWSSSFFWLQAVWSFRRISSDSELKDSSPSREDEEILQFNSSNWREEAGAIRCFCRI